MSGGAFDYLYCKDDLPSSTLESMARGAERERARIVALIRRRLIGYSQNDPNCPSDVYERTVGKVDALEDLLESIERGEHLEEKP